MKWTIKLVPELGQGEPLEREITTIEREDQVGPASIGLTIRRGQKHHGGPAERVGDGSDGTARGCHQILSAVRKSVPHQGLLPIHFALRIRKSPDARPADQGMFLFRITKPNICYCHVEPLVSDGMLDECRTARTVAIGSRERSSRTAFGFTSVSA